MQLKQLNKVLICFSPWTGTARSAREFLARCTAPKAVASNPDCKIEHKLKLKGEPFIDIEYNNKEKDRIMTADLTVTQILNRIKTTSETMDTNQQLKIAGYSELKLDSDWNAAPGRERDCGEKFNGPPDKNK